MSTFFLDISGQPARGSWEIDLSLPGFNPEKSTTIAFTPPQDLAAADLSWYMNRFHQEPYELLRASNVENYIRNFGQILHKSLLGCNFVRNNIPTDAKKVCIVIRNINANGSSLFALPWELLELALLPNQPSVQVVREVAANPLLRLVDASVSWKHARILIVVARCHNRDNNSRDIDSQLITRPLFELLAGAEGDASRQVHIDIATPGTFEAFKSYLAHAKKAKQPYSVVHFDLHGLIRKSSEGNAKAALEFLGGYDEGGQLYADLRTAPEVAGVLRSHGVKLVTLNACESANPEANFAEELVRDGIPFVVASAWKLHRSAALLFMKRFYEALLIEVVDIATALVNARAFLRQDAERDCWFEEAREVHDWFSMVMYCREGLSLWDPSTGADTASRPNANIPPPARLTEQPHARLTEQPVDRLTVRRSLELLRLETALAFLKQDPAVEPVGLVLWGMAGCGKTAFIRDACSWWSATHFAQQTLYIPNDSQSWRRLDVLRTVWGLDAGADFGSDLETFAFLESSFRIIVIEIDTVEQLVEEWEDFLTAYQSRDVSKPRSLFVFVTADGDASQLDSEVLFNFQLSNMHPVEAYQLAVQVARQTGLPSLRPPIELKTKEELEILLVLLDCNPLAIRTVIPWLANQDTANPCQRLAEQLLCGFAGSSFEPETGSNLSTVEVDFLNGENLAALLFAPFVGHIPENVVLFLTFACGLDVDTLNKLHPDLTLLKPQVRELFGGLESRGLPFKDRVSTLQNLGAVFLDCGLGRFLSETVATWRKLGLLYNCHLTGDSDELSPLFSLQAIHPLLTILLRKHASGYMLSTPSSSLLEWTHRPMKLFLQTLLVVLGATASGDGDPYWKNLPRIRHTSNPYAESYTKAYFHNLVACVSGPFVNSSQGPEWYIDAACFGILHSDTQWVLPMLDWLGSYASRCGGATEDGFSVVFQRAVTKRWEGIVTGFTACFVVSVWGYGSHTGNMIFSVRRAKHLEKLMQERARRDWSSTHEAVEVLDGVLAYTADDCHGRVILGPYWSEVFQRATKIVILSLMYTAQTAVKRGELTKARMHIEAMKTMVDQMDLSQETYYFNVRTRFLDLMATTGLDLQTGPESILRSLLDYIDSSPLELIPVNPLIPGNSPEKVKAMNRYLVGSWLRTMSKSAALDEVLDEDEKFVSDLMFQIGYSQEIEQGLRGILQGVESVQAETLGGLVNKLTKHMYRALELIEDAKDTTRSKDQSERARAALEIFSLFSNDRPNDVKNKVQPQLQEAMESRPINWTDITRLRTLLAMVMAQKQDWRATQVHLRKASEALSNLLAETTSEVLQDYQVSLELMIALSSISISLETAGKHFRNCRKLSEGLGSWMPRCCHYVAVVHLVLLGLYKDEKEEIDLCFECLSLLYAPDMIARRQKSKEGIICFLDKEFSEMIMPFGFEWPIQVYQFMRQFLSLYDNNREDPHVQDLIIAGGFSSFGGQFIQRIQNFYLSFQAGGESEMILRCQYVISRLLPMTTRGEEEVGRRMEDLAFAFPTSLDRGAVDSLAYETELALFDRECFFSSSR